MAQTSESSALLAASGDYDCEVKPVRSLSPADVSDWNALCAVCPDGDSPLLGPHFAQLAGSVRDDVRCAFIRRRGRLECVLAFHARPLGLARPVGAPFNDYSGPVMHPECVLDLTAILELAGIACYRTDTLVSPAPAMAAACAPQEEQAFVIDRNGLDSAELFAGLRARNVKRFKNFSRLRRRLSEEKGEPVLQWGAPSASSLEKLLSLKSAQFRQEGLVDIINATHSSRLLRAAAQAESPELRGFMVWLSLDDEIVAGHFGVRNARCFHPWVSAYNPAYGDYGPGIILLLDIVQSMAAMDLASYDLASGHGHYKKYFANRSRGLYGASASSQAVSGRLQDAGYGLWNFAGARNNKSPAARLRRRLDHIAACEPGLPQRLSGVALAFFKRL